MHVLGSVLLIISALAVLYTGGFKLLSVEGLYGALAPLVIAVLAITASATLVRNRVSASIARTGGVVCVALGAATVGLVLLSWRDSTSNSAPGNLGLTVGVAALMLAGGLACYRARSTPRGDSRDGG